MPYQFTPNKISQDVHRTTSERFLDALPGLLVWVALAVSITCALFFPRSLMWVATLLAVYTALRFLFAGIANRYGIRLIQEWEKRDWNKTYQTQRTTTSLDWGLIQHIVIIPNYNEPVSILRRSLSSLAKQYKADQYITVILAMEEREEGCKAKAMLLIEEFKTAFKHITLTIHPAQLPGEIACKSANERWAIQQTITNLSRQEDYHRDHIIVTTMDADTRWHPHYFYALTALFALDEQRYLRFWQAPIRYHGNIWEINPLLRMVNAYATAFELSYLASPWWLALPMSSYSLSLRLLEESGYWDGDVIADEWHMFIKAYYMQAGRVQTEAVMLPFIADATNGDTLIDEIKERYLQTLRHAWGSKEIGYMVTGMMSVPGVPIRSSTRYLFRVSHDILMAGAGWVLLTVGSQLPVLLHPQIAPFNPLDILQNPGDAPDIILSGLIDHPMWLILSSSVLLVLVLAVIFWYQDVQVRPPRTHPQSIPERLLTALSFPLMPIITLIVLAIPAIDAQTRLMLGIPLQFRVSNRSSQAE